MHYSFPKAEMSKYNLISLKHITVVQRDSLISFFVSVEKFFLYVSIDFQICDYDHYLYMEWPKY